MRSGSLKPRNKYRRVGSRRIVWRERVTDKRQYFERKQKKRADTAAHETDNLFVEEGEIL